VHALHVTGVAPVTPWSCTVRREGGTDGSAAGPGRRRPCHRDGRRAGPCLPTPTGAEPVTYGEGLYERITALAPNGVTPPSTRWAPTRPWPCRSPRGRPGPHRHHRRIPAWLRARHQGDRWSARSRSRHRGAVGGRMELVKRAEAGTLSVLIAATYHWPTRPKPYVGWPGATPTGRSSSYPDRWRPVLDDGGAR